MKKSEISIYQLSLRVFTPEGTLRAAEKMLPMLADLGPKYIQLVALTKADDNEDRTYWSNRQIASGTNNPKNSYRMKDYFHVDEEYGTDEDFRDFVKAAHKLGLKIILDLVYLHCGPEAVFMREHPDFIQRDADGKIKLTGDWAFPRFDYSNDEVREYLWSNMVYWVREFDVDGFRCDVGDAVPLDFWREGVRRAREVKNDLVMINEGKDVSYLDVFDINYFYDGCFDAVQVAEGNLTAAAFRAKWDACRNTLPAGRQMLHFTDNHDVASDNGEDRIEKVRTFAARYGCCMVVKGAHTMVCSPDGQLYFNATGNPGMAKGGSGDVLTGIIGAFAAQGIEPFRAALLGLYVHGAAGDKAAAYYGQEGMNAADLIDFLGEALAEIQ